ncbi:ATP-binding cassette domain-containing protein [Terasakiispira papahanaumokuakeensis]|nr:ATP-binding cassette domain-containing protein [Terasakiispira papahanaumokuakeensis]
MKTQQMMSLQVEALTLTMKGHSQPLVGPLSWRLEAGQCMGLVGGSGAGKSLVADALFQALPAEIECQGRMTLNDAPLSPLSMALMPQSIEALDPLAPVTQQIRRFARRNAEAVDPTRLLAQVQLEAEAGALFPHQLSGGMARRVLLALTLATGADWLVIDEPTLGLDPTVADQLIQLLSTLKAQGKGVLLISHDLVRLIQVADEVMILASGQQVETAPVAAFDGSGGGLKHPFSRALWQAQQWTQNPLTIHQGDER